MQSPDPIPFPDLAAQHALAPLVDSAAELVTDDDLIRIAENLARQFEYNANSAFAADVLWYQDRVDVRVCTRARAELLRNMTILACIHHCCDHTRTITRVQAAVDHDFDELVERASEEPAPAPKPFRFDSLPNRLNFPAPSGQEQDAEELAVFLNRSRVHPLVAFAAGSLCTLLALVLCARFA